MRRIFRQWIETLQRACWLTGATLAFLPLAGVAEPPAQCIVATVDDVLTADLSPHRHEALRELYGRNDWRLAWLDAAHTNDGLRPLIDML